MKFQMHKKNKMELNYKLIGQEDTTNFYEEKSSDVHFSQVQMLHENKATKPKKVVFATQQIQIAYLDISWDYKFYVAAHCHFKINI